MKRNGAPEFPRQYLDRTRSCTHKRELGQRRCADVGFYAITGRSVDPRCQSESAFISSPLPHKKFAICEHTPMTQTKPIRITFTKSATRRWSDMSRSQRDKVRGVLESLTADHTFRHNQLRALKETENGFRFRLGPWRVSFTLDRPAGILEVFEVEVRGSAYR